MKKRSLLKKEKILTLGCVKPVYIPNFHISQAYSIAKKNGFDLFARKVPGGLNVWRLKRMSKEDVIEKIQFAKHTISQVIDGFQYPGRLDAASFELEKWLAEVKVMCDESGNYKP